MARRPSRSRKGRLCRPPRGSCPREGRKGAMEGPTAASPSPLVTYIFAASLRGQEPLGDRRSRLGALVTDDEQSPDPNQSWSLHGEIHSRRHAWLTNRKPTKVGNNTLKYQRIDAALRAQRRIEWNRPVIWPLFLLILVFGVAVWPAWRGYRRRETASAR